MKNKFIIFNITVILFIFFATVLLVNACDKTDLTGAIYCTGSTTWCGNICQNEPSCSAPKTQVSCTSCGCTCPSAYSNDCTSANGLCQATNTSCDALHKNSVCNTDSGQTTQACGSGCVSGWNDCDSNGSCEIQNGASCTTSGGKAGKYSGCSGGTGNCNEIGTSLWNNGTGGIYYNDANVGIGINSPTTQLQIYKNSVLDRGLILRGGYSSSGQRHQNLMTFMATTQANADPFSDTSGENSKNWHLGIVTDSAWFNGSYFSIINSGAQRLIIDNSGNVTANANIIAAGGSGADASSYLGLFKGNGSLPQWPAESRPTVKTNGNYVYFSAGGQYTGFIGTPSGTYGVFGINDPSRNTNVYLNSSGNSYFVGGNVGIGTTNPTSKLHMVTSGQPGAYMLISSSGSGNAQTFFTNSHGYTWWVGLDSAYSNRFAIGRGSSRYLTIDTSGVVSFNYLDVGEYITADATHENWALSPSCAAGYRVTGGGCYCPSYGVNESYPENESQWKCSCYAQWPFTTTCYARAMCARI